MRPLAAIRPAPVAGPGEPQCGARAPASMPGRWWICDAAKGHPAGTDHATRAGSDGVLCKAWPQDAPAPYPCCRHCPADPGHVPGHAQECELCACQAIGCDGNHDPELTLGRASGPEPTADLIGWAGRRISGLSDPPPAPDVLVSQCECGELARHRQHCRWREGYGSVVTSPGLAYDIRDGSHVIASGIPGDQVNDLLTGDRTVTVHPEDHTACERAGAAKLLATRAATEGRAELARHAAAAAAPETAQQAVNVLASQALCTLWLRKLIAEITEMAGGPS